MADVIRNIIFDLGGVILPIFPEKTMAAFGASNKSSQPLEVIIEMVQDVVIKLETGSIDAKAFLTSLSHILGHDNNVNDLLHAWNLMLGLTPSENFEILRRTRSQYRTFLLSNTNPIHYEVYAEEFLKAGGKDRWSAFFEGMVLSFKEGMMKPSERIFHLILQRFELVPDQCLFIDDNPANVQAARLAGMKAHCLDPSMKLTSLFSEQGRLRSDLLLC